jgi:hypothetical protein
MPTQVPLMNRGAIPLQQSGTMVARTAQLTAGDTGMGRALQGIGAQFEDMAIKEQEANDARLMIDFEGEMRKAVDEQSVFQQQVQEQSEWLPAWQKRSTDLQKRLDGLKVSDKTRLNLTQSFGQFADRHTLNIRGQAFEQSQTRAKMTGQVRLQQAKTPEEVDQVISLMKNSNVGLPEQWDMEREPALNRIKSDLAGDFRAKFRQGRESGDGLSMLQAAQSAHQAGVLTDAEYEEAANDAGRVQALSAFTDAARKDPIIAKNQLKVGEFKELKGDDLFRAENIAEGILRDYESREVGDFADYVENGGKPDAFKFQWNVSDAKRGELVRAATQESVMTPEQAASKRLELEARIGKYDMDKDPDRMEMLKISADLDAYKRAVPYMASDLGMAWGGKKSGDKGGIASMEIADNDDYIAKLYKPKMDALLDDKGAIKPGKEAEFRKLQSEATEKKKLFRAQIGTDPTPEKARKTSQNILTLPVADEVANYFDMFGMDSTPLIPSIQNQPRQELQP